MSAGQEAAWTQTVSEKNGPSQSGSYHPLPRKKGKLRDCVGRRVGSPFHAHRVWLGVQTGVGRGFDCLRASGGGQAGLSEPTWAGLF